LTEFFKNFLNARRIVVADSGHLMYWEKPQEFTRIVIGFLQAIAFRLCYGPIHDFKLRALKNRRFFPLVVVGFFVSLHSPVVQLPLRKGKLNE